MYGEKCFQELKILPILKNHMLTDLSSIVYLNAMSLKRPSLKIVCFLYCSGRFQQLEILDHVASAFSSLLNEVNTLQSKAEERDGEDSVQRTSVGGAEEHQGRVGELLRRASKQDSRADCSSKGSESPKNREEFSIPSAQPGARTAQLPAMTDSHDHSPLSPPAEHWSLQACDDLTPCRPPRALLKKWWPSTPMLARQAPASCMSEGSVKDRTPKENWIQTNKLRSFSGVSRVPDSFELEEVSVAPLCSAAEGGSQRHPLPSFNPFIGQPFSRMSYCSKLLPSLGHLRSF